MKSRLGLKVAWVVACAWFISAMFISATASATVINVNTFAGESVTDGNCSISEAIEAANTNQPVDACPAGQSSGTDRIVVNLFGTITLAETLTVTEQVSIEGRGRDLTRLSGDNQRKILRVNMTNLNHDFTLSDMRLEDGRNRNTSLFQAGAAAQLIQGSSFVFRNVNFFSNGVDWTNGGAIFAGPLADNPNATLTIENCLFDSNFAERNGGAIATYTSGDFQALRSIRITGSRFINNRTSGILPSTLGLYDLQSITIESSQFENNGSFNTVGDGNGSAVQIVGVDPRTLTIIRDTGFVNNEGRALVLNGGDALLSNTLFYQNDPTASESEGAAIGLFFDAFANVIYSTFVDNGDSQGSQIGLCADCSANLDSSIVWSDSGEATDCRLQAGAVLNSLGNNLDATGSCAIAADDLPMTDPLLLPLDVYGPQSLFYAVKSMPPRTSSPAVDIGPETTCPGFFGAPLSNDQRGYDRPVDGNADGLDECDSGAVEYQPGLDEDDFALSVVFLGNGDGRVVSTPAGIDCTDNCSSVFLEDTEVSLTATPEPGNVFAGWSGACIGSAACSVTMDQAQTVTASFVVSSFDLNLSVIGNGSVQSAPAGINCPGDCTQQYASGTIVTLTPNPNSGFEFSGWSGGGCTGTGPCEVVMSSIQNVIATFGRTEYDLTVSVDGDGTVSSNPAGIDCPGDCVETYLSDSVITLTATPDAGSIFTGWSGACSGTGVCQVSMSEARSVGAAFASAGFSLTVEIDGNGSGTVTSMPAGIICPGTCSAMFDPGQAVTLVATPDSDQSFQNWTGDCSGSGACSVIMKDDRQAGAVFRSALTLFIDGFE